VFYCQTTQVVIPDSDDLFMLYAQSP